LVADVGTCKQLPIGSCGQVKEEVSEEGDNLRSAGDVREEAEGPRKAASALDGTQASL
jgi:hypothetical protein